MTKIKNISPGPRFLQTSGGTVTLDPGQVWEGDLAEGAMKSLERRASRGKDEFQFDADIEEETGEADEFDAMTDQQLRDFITDRDGKAPRGNTSRNTLLSKARGAE